MAAPDWFAIEADYKAGKKSVNAIAVEHGISEGAIRKRAKKSAWVRDPTATVREKVKAHIAGAGTNGTNGTNDGTNSLLRTMMDEAAKNGIVDMQMGLSNARLALHHVEKYYLAFPDDELIAPRDLKTLNEANAGAVETIRRIRQLDDPEQKAVQLTGFRMVVE